MQVDWDAVFTSVGSTTVVLAVVGWVARSLFSQHLSRDIEAFKSDLRIAADRAQHRFTVLHERRAGVLERAHALVVRVNRAAADLLAELEYEGEPSKVDKSKTLTKLGNELGVYFDEHSIYFSESTCTKFEALVSAIRDPAFRFSVAVHLSEQHPDNNETAKLKLDAWIEGARKLREEVPPLRDALANDFRRILGVEEPE